ncbi:MAG: YfhO family protein, partial [Nitrospinales bacterium]
MSSNLDFNAYFGKSFIWENNCYMGVIAFSLFLIAFQGWKEGREKFWISTFALTFIIALGSFTPLFRLLYEVLPGFSMFRGYAKTLTLTCLALALLAGMGLDRIQSQPPNNPSKVTFASISLILLGLTAWASVSIDTIPFWKQNLLEKLSGWRITNPPENILNPFTQVLRNHLSLMTLFTLLATGLYLYSVRIKIFRKNIGALLCVLLFLELFYFAKSFLSPLRFNEITIADPLIQPVREEPVWTRVFHQEALIANLEIPRQVPSVAGYETLPLRAYGKMVNHFNKTSSQHKNAYLVVQPTKKRMDFLAAKYLLVDKNLKLPFPVEQVATGQAYTRKLNLYEWPGTLPRYHFPKKIRPYSIDTPEDFNNLESYGRLVDEILNNYPSTVFVSADGYRQLSKINSSEPDSKVKGGDTLQVIREETNRVILDVEKTTPGMLVVSENYYPGWQSRIDGKETPVYPVNLIMKGVKVPAGKHRIEFEFIPTRFFTYLTVSFMSLLGLLCMMGWSGRRLSPPKNEYTGHSTGS